MPSAFCMSDFRKFFHLEHKSRRHTRRTVRILWSKPLAEQLVHLSFTYCSLRDLYKLQFPAFAEGEENEYGRRSDLEECTAGQTLAVSLSILCSI
jgi:hypothetical protein